MQQSLFTPRANYYNTTHERGRQLAASERKANEQEQAVLDVYQRNRFRMPPCRVWKILDQRWPITSVRRAVHGLTQAGMLRKTDYMVVGHYGKKVHTWEYVGGRTD